MLPCPTSGCSLLLMRAARGACSREERRGGDGGPGSRWCMRTGQGRGPVVTGEGRGRFFISALTAHASDDDRRECISAGTLGPGGEDRWLMGERDLEGVGRGGLRGGERCFCLFPPDSSASTSQGDACITWAGSVGRFPTRLRKAAIAPAGMDWFLTKPVVPKVVKELIDSLPARQPPGALPARQPNPQPASGPSSAPPPSAVAPPPATPSPPAPSSTALSSSPAPPPPSRA